MATTPTPTPITVVNNTGTPTATVSSTQTWLQKHERLLIVFMVLCVLAWGIQKHYDDAAAKADARATIAEQAKAQADSTVAASVAQTAQVTSQYQALIQTLASQNAALAQSLAARQQAQAVQVATDAHLAPSDLAVRLQTLGNAPSGSVSVTPTGLALTQPAAVDVTQTLEQVPVLQSDLKDTTASLQATQVAQSKANEVIADQGKQINDLNLARVDDDKACTADKNQLKADAKKNNIKWFKRGFLFGFVGGLWAGHAGGL